MSAIYCEGCWEITDHGVTVRALGEVVFRGHYDCWPDLPFPGWQPGLLPFLPPKMSTSRGPIVYSRPDPWVRP